jgi:hypothetical protein
VGGVNDVVIVAEVLVPVTPLRVTVTAQPPTVGEVQIFVPATTGTVVEAGAAPDVHAAVPLVGAAAVGVAAGVLLPAQPAIAAASAMAANAPMVTRERGDPIIACVPSADRFAGEA